MNKTLYLFYYESMQIVDHDSDGAVYELERTNLSGFYKLENGLNYYKEKYPNKLIKHELIDILDNEE